MKRAVIYLMLAMVAISAIRAEETEKGCVPLLAVPFMANVLGAADTNVSPYNGIYVAGSIDPKVALVDGELVYRVKVFTHLNRWETSVVYEDYPMGRYKGLSIGVDRDLVRFWVVQMLLGVEVTNIRNYNPDKLHEHTSYGINAETRFNLNDRWSVSLQANYKERPDIRDRYMFSGYVNVNCRGIKKLFKNR